MVSVVKDKITAYISPPGGGAFKALIDDVWAAYQTQKSGGSVGQQATATPSADEQNAALRAQVAALTAQAQARAAGVVPATGLGLGAKDPTLDHVTDDGAVFNDPKLGSVTVGDNGMKYTWTLAPGGTKPAHYTAEFEGSETEAGAGKKALKLAKGVGTAVVDSRNTHANATSSITGNTDVWRIKEEEGKTKTLLYESGGLRTGGYIEYTGRDPLGRRGEDMLYEISRIYELAKREIAAATQNGKAVSFDTTTDRAQRGEAALKKATEDYTRK